MEMMQKSEKSSERCSANLL